MSHQPTKELADQAREQAWTVTDGDDGWLCLTPTGDAIYLRDSPDEQYARNCLTQLRRLGLRPPLRASPGTEDL